VIGKRGLGSGEGGPGSGPALRESGQIGTYNRPPLEKKQNNTSVYNKTRIKTKTKPSSSPYKRLPRYTCGLRCKREFRLPNHDDNIPYLTVSTYSCSPSSSLGSWQLEGEGRGFSSRELDRDALRTGLVPGVR
jgi:hypothetical protein